MDILSLLTGFVIGPNTDLESTRYRILARLRSIRSEFRRNVLYPHYIVVNEAYKDLCRLAKSLDEISRSNSYDLEGVDLHSLALIRQMPQFSNIDHDLFSDLVLWTSGEVKSVLDEGYSLCEFVDENMDMESVGIVPNRINEGYWFVRSTADRLYRVFRYSVGRVTLVGEDKMFSMCTGPVADFPAHRVPVGIKMELIERFPELPVPAVFVFNPKLELPIDSTVIPSAKRMLLRYVAKKTNRPPLL